MSVPWSASWPCRAQPHSFPRTRADLLLPCWRIAPGVGPNRVRYGLSQVVNGMQPPAPRTTMTLQAPILWRTFIGLVVLVQLLTGPPAVGAQKAKAGVEVPFEFIHNQIVVQVRINGKGP